ncbi:MAG: hypothetical protein V4658_09380 [Bacteroidota bacterium]
MEQRYVINNDLLNDFDVENVINCTKNYSKTQLSQYLKKRFDGSYLLVAEQVELFEKLKHKLPQWAAAGCLVTRKSLEQCSSPALASFKAGLVKGHTLIDLSGGLGVDDVAFGKQFKKVFSVDPDQELNELVRYNFNRLLIKNIDRIDADAEGFAEAVQTPVDVFYIDADRRPSSNAKVFTLEDSSPDVIRLMPVLVEKSNLVMLKLSPMVDLKLVMNTFGNCSGIYVVGVKNEVKEVLVILGKGKQDPVMQAVEVNADGKVIHRFPAAENPVSSILPKEGMAYFYEPSNMIIKAGLSVPYAAAVGLAVVNKNSHYAVSTKLVNDYFGRSFNVIYHGVFSKSVVKTYLKQNDISKANVSARNFVSTVEEIRQTFTIDDGGEEYLFFTQDAARNKLFWHCRKV